MLMFWLYVFMFSWLIFTFGFILMFSFVFMYCFNINFLTYLVYYCVCTLPCLQVYVNIYFFILILMRSLYMSSCYNIDSDRIYLFKFCIGFDKLSICQQVIHLANFIFEIFLFLYKLFIYNIIYVKDKKERKRKIHDLSHKFWKKCRFTRAESWMTTVIEGGSWGFEGDELLGVCVYHMSNQ